MKVCMLRNILFAFYMFPSAPVFKMLLITLSIYANTLYANVFSSNKSNLLLVHEIQWTTDIKPTRL